MNGEGTWRLTRGGRPSPVDTSASSHTVFAPQARIRKRAESPPTEEYPQGTCRPRPPFTASTAYHHSPVTDSCFSPIGGNMHLLLGSPQQGSRESHDYTCICIMH